MMILPLILILHSLTSVRNFKMYWDIFKRILKMEYLLRIWFSVFSTTLEVPVLLNLYPDATESGKEPAKLVTNTSSYEVAEEEPLGPVAAPTIAAPLVKEDWVCCDKCQAWGFCHLVKFLDIFLRSGFVVCSTGCLE